MKKPEHEFDQYKDSYQSQVQSAIAFSGQSHDYFTSVKAENIARLVAKHGAQSSTRLLDIGCGHGIIHKFLQEKSPQALELFGTDVAESVLEIAKKNNSWVKYQSYDGLKLPYADGFFGAAYAICVLHHVPPSQWSSFMQEAYRVVQPGGWVAIFEHNPLNPMTRKVVNSCEFDKDAVLLRAGKLEKLFQQAGFKGIQTQFILFTPFDSGFFRVFDRSMSWLPLGAQYFTVGRK